jgi:hypothetical protein
VALVLSKGRRLLDHLPLLPSVEAIQDSLAADFTLRRTAFKKKTLNIKLTVFDENVQGSCGREREYTMKKHISAQETITTTYDLIRKFITIKRKA